MSDKVSKSREKKDQLLALAKSGVKRPGMTDKLGISLNNYTSASGHSYDAEFSAEIRSIAASWFRAPKKIETV